MGGLLGGGGSKVPQVDKDIQKLIREGLRLRLGFMPSLMQQYGYGMTRHETGGIGGNPSYEITQLPPTPQQQAIERLGLTSLGGAQNAAEMMNQRLQMAQGLLPGLMGSVRASMAPGQRPSWVPRTDQTAGMSPLPRVTSPIPLPSGAGAEQPPSPQATLSPSLAQLLQQIQQLLNSSGG